jgi:RNA-directed DNA polymerase
VEVGLSERTRRNAMARVRQLTPRTWGGTLQSTALAEAKRHVRDGYEWVVRHRSGEVSSIGVNHQRLISRLAQRVSDRRLLVLIARLLKAKVVLPDGVVIGVDEGVPQGSPLSPLLSNIVLDELDAELSRRGHRFVRYADDCNVYVRSQRAGQRVMASLTAFIQWRLRLRINACIHRINAWLRGWHQFFGIASAEEQQQMRRIDAHIRRRLRAIVLHH